MNRGFTIVELMVSIAIFVILTAVVTAKYGNFNQSTLLTDTAYDVALVLRLAQSYGISVRNSGDAGTANFNVPYGVDFNQSSIGLQCGGTGTSDYKNMTLFADTDPIGTPDHQCTSSDANISSYLITRGAYITSMCAASDVDSCRNPGASATRLQISYQRPNPEAIIYATNGGTTVCDPVASPCQYAEITIAGTDGSKRKIIVNQIGQISVSN